MTRVIGSKKYTWTNCEVQSSINQMLKSKFGKKIQQKIAIKRMKIKNKNKKN
jgi:hypothetical protein